MNLNQESNEKPTNKTRRFNFEPTWLRQVEKVGIKRHERT